MIRDTRTRITAEDGEFPSSPTTRQKQPEENRWGHNRDSLDVPGGLNVLPIAAYQNVSFTSDGAFGEDDVVRVAERRGNFHGWKDEFRGITQS